MANLNKMGKDYGQGHLNKHDLAADPLEQFDTWLQAALGNGVAEANACTLATASSDGQPSSRVVLLKYYDPNGFVFFTNYTSRKGHDLEVNPKAALGFWWREREQQVRIEGDVVKLDAAHSDRYYQVRSPLSNLAALASPQSQEIASRQVLMDKYEQLKADYPNDPPPRPEHWGGYIIKPNYYEFWQGGSHRLHDRFCYRLVDGSWTIARLAP